MKSAEIDTLLAGARTTWRAAVERDERAGEHVSERRLLRRLQARSGDRRRTWLLVAFAALVFVGVLAMRRPAPETVFEIHAEAVAAPSALHDAVVAPPAPMPAIGVAAAPAVAAPEDRASEDRPPEAKPPSTVLPPLPPLPPPDRAPDVKKEKDKEKEKRTRLGRSIPVDWLEVVKERGRARGAGRVVRPSSGTAHPTTEPPRE